MSDEISRFGTGERGTFKIEQPERERPAKVNTDVLTKEVERGSWIWNRRTKLLEVFERRRAKHTHAVHTDTMAPTESPLIPMHEKPYITDSKSAMDRHLRENGYSRVSAAERRQEQAKQEAERLAKLRFNLDEHREHWERAGEDVRYGNVAMSELEREACRREERYLRERAKGSRSDYFERKLAEQGETITVTKG